MGSYGRPKHRSRKFHAGGHYSTRSPSALVAYESEVHAVWFSYRRSLVGNGWSNNDFKTDYIRLMIVDPRTVHFPKLNVKFARNL
jgi:hypothetical protein